MIESDNYYPNSNLFFTSMKKWGVKSQKKGGGGENKVCLSQKNKIKEIKDLISMLIHFYIILTDYEFWCASLMGS